MNTEMTEEEKKMNAEEIAAAEASASPEMAAEESVGEEGEEDTAASEQAAQENADSAEEASAESAAPVEEKPAEPDWKDRFARLLAEFDNFRKRTERDREELVKSAARGVIKDVLATVDNLARALDGAKDKADDPFVQGVKLVYDGLLKTLENNGATPLDSVGEPFDVNYHEALAQMPSPDVEEGIVMNEVSRGWLLNGKLLRAAKVVVSAGKGE